MELNLCVSWFTGSKSVTLGLSLSHWSGQDVFLHDITVWLDLNDQALVESKGEFRTDCHVFAINGESWIFGFWIIFLDNLLLFRHLLILFALLWGYSLLLIGLNSFSLLVLALGSLGQHGLFGSIHCILIFIR